MIAHLKRIHGADLERLISSKVAVRLSHDESIRFRRCLRATTKVWVGAADDTLLCVWGLIPPTLMSNSAHLWLHVVEDLREFKFIFIRNSQRVIEMVLEEYPVITGECFVDAERSIRWVKWLGAKFGEPQGKIIPFTITKDRGDG